MMQRISLEPRRTQRQTRRGFTIIEILVSAGVVITLFAVAGPTLRLVHWQSRDADRYAVAVNEVVNIIDELRAKGDTWSDEDLEAVALSRNCQEQLPEAALRIESNAFSESERDGAPASDRNPGLSGQRLTVTLSWDQGRGMNHMTVRLSCWVFAGGEK